MLKGKKFKKSSSFLDEITESLVGPLAKSREFLQRETLVRVWIGVWGESLV